MEELFRNIFHSGGCVKDGRNCQNISIYIAMKIFFGNYQEKDNFWTYIWRKIIDFFDTVFVLLKNEISFNFFFFILIINIYFFLHYFTTHLIYLLCYKDYIFVEDLCFNIKWHLYSQPLLCKFSRKMGNSQTNDAESN